MRHGVPSSQLIMDFRGPQPAMRWDARAYREAALAMGGTRFEGACPVEAGFLGALVDHECRHGLLPGQRTCCP